MILLLGDVGEEVLGLVVARLAKARAEFTLVDSRADRHAVDLAWRADCDGAGGWLRSGEQTVALADLCSVYVRDIGRAEETPTSGTIIAKSGMLEGLPCRVVNRPSANATNASKPYQSLIIARHGLAVLVHEAPGRRAAALQGHRERVGLVGADLAEGAEALVRVQEHEPLVGPEPERGTEH